MIHSEFPTSGSKLFLNVLANFSQKGDTSSMENRRKHMEKARVISNFYYSLLGLTIGSVISQGIFRTWDWLEVVHVAIYQIAALGLIYLSGHNATISTTKQEDTCHSSQ